MSTHTQTQMKQLILWPNHQLHKHFTADHWSNCYRLPHSSNSIQPHTRLTTRWARHHRSKPDLQFNNNNNNSKTGRVLIFKCTKTMLAYLNSPKWLVLSHIWWYFWFTLAIWRDSLLWSIASDIGNQSMFSLKLLILSSNKSIVSLSELILTLNLL